MAYRRWIGGVMTHGRGGAIESGARYPSI